MQRFQKYAVLGLVAAVPAAAHALLLPPPAQSCLTSGTSTYRMSAGAETPDYRVRIDNVRVGDITLNNVEASVQEGSGLDIALLGMSFLNRTQMNREGDRLTLIRRY